jgi:hypothetical protein
MREFEPNDEGGASVSHGLVAVKSAVGIDTFGPDAPQPGRQLHLKKIDFVILFLAKKWECKGAFTQSSKVPSLIDEFVRLAKRLISPLCSAQTCQIHAEQTRRASTLLDSVNAPQLVKYAPSKLVKQIKLN